METRMWLAARSPTWISYPCRCHERPRDCGKNEPWGCPCWGRYDLASLPLECCARRNPRTQQGLAREAQRLLDSSLGLRLASSPWET